MTASRSAALVQQILGARIISGSISGTRRERSRCDVSNAPHQLALATATRPELCFIGMPNIGVVQTIQTGCLYMCFWSLVLPLCFSKTRHMHAAAYVIDRRQSSGEHAWLRRHRSSHAESVALLAAHDSDCRCMCTHVHVVCAQTACGVALGAHCCSLYGDHGFGAGRSIAHTRSGGSTVYNPAGFVCCGQRRHMRECCLFWALGTLTNAVPCGAREIDDCSVRRAAGQCGIHNWKQCVILYLTGEHRYLGYSLNSGT